MAPKHNILVTGGAGFIGYNVGNGCGFSVRQVIEVARRVTGRNIPVVEKPRRQGDAAVLVASSDRIRQGLGCVPQFPNPDEIVSSAWEWSCKHPCGYRES